MPPLALGLGTGDVAVGAGGLTLVLSPLSSPGFPLSGAADTDGLGGETVESPSPVPG